MPDGRVISSPENGKKGGRPPNGPISLDEERRLRLAMRGRFIQLMSENADSIFHALLDLAHGHFVERETPAGVVRIYRKSPDVNALSWMLEHVWGRAKQPLEVEGSLAVAVADLEPEVAAELARAITYALPDAEPVTTTAEGTEGNADAPGNPGAAGQ